MLFTSPVYSQASGSIAGITYSHCRGGMYVKSRRKPTNPNTERQRKIRIALKILAPYWGQTLTAVERAAWDLYASNVPWKNALGQTIFLTGHQHFLRTNVVRLQTAYGILDAAPIIYDLGTFTAPTITGATDLPQLSIGFNNLDDWCSDTTGAMVVWSSRSAGPGHKFFEGPWRYEGRITGDLPPPASPQNFAVDWPWGAGNLAWAKIRVLQKDGRMSAPTILGPEIIA